MKLLRIVMAVTAATMMSGCGNGFNTAFNIDRLLGGRVEKDISQTSNFTQQAAQDVPNGNQ